MQPSNMGKTQLDTINSKYSKAKVVAALPTTADSYYGLTGGQEVGNDQWLGGELAYLTSDATLHIQTETSGYTATWRGLADTFATTSTSTSTSTSSSTSSTTSSTSSSTSTSTSTSSSTSTSTSTSSTTTP